MAGLCERCIEREARSAHDLYCDPCEVARRKDRVSATLFTLLTTPQVAESLGLHRTRVWQLAEELGVGRKIGDRWLFTPDDLAALRERKTAPGPARGSRRKRGEED